jgi:hypothetical protein
MAFTGNFSAAQGTDLSSLTIVDTSSGGTDPAITTRVIYLYKVDGTTLVPAGTTTAYINFPIVSGAGDSLTVNVITKDYSLRIYVVWTSTSPISGAVYEKSTVFTATGNTNLAAYEILQTVSAQNSILNNDNYFENFSKLYVNIDCAVQAQVYGDQYSSQSALDRAYELTSNQSKYF